MHGVDGVFHAAALKRIEVGNYNPEEMAATNITGSQNVIQAARDANVSKVVLASSDKAYKAIGPYGLSKAFAEHLFLAANRTSGQNGPRFAVCRYGNVAGATGSVIPYWLKLISTGAPVPVTDPECTRFWIDVHEAVKMITDTMSTMFGGELVIPVLKAFRLKDLAEAMDAKTKIIGLPAWEKKAEQLDDVQSSDTNPRLSVAELRQKLEGVYATLGYRRG
jgi:UDP-N-acetylglucosamine 4,6-dehydratase